MNDIQAGAVVSGYPEMPHLLWLRVFSLSRRLPELYKTLRQLQPKG